MYFIIGDNEFKLRGSESDDTASTISTVVDNFSSIHSTISDASTTTTTTIQPSKSATELAKVIKSFTMLEKEFNVESLAVATSAVSAGKLDEYIMSLQPPVSFQDENNKRCVKLDSSGQVYQNVLVNSVTENRNNYENVLVQSKTEQRTYENVEVKRKAEINNDHRKLPPTPLPRQAIQGIDEKAMITNSQSTALLHTKSYIEEIHDCTVVADLSERVDSTEAKKTESNESDAPKLIKFLPKYFSENAVVRNDDQRKEPAIRMCIPVNVSGADGDYDDNNYMTSSSDEDEEKSYEPNALSVDRRDSSDTLSDEDGEKLGPPDIINGPGSSEAYFNFHWPASMLPTIGEVEEEMSSLEPQPFG